jgi:hypothetical protein
MFSQNRLTLLFNFLTFFAAATSCGIASGMNGMSLTASNTADLADRSVKTIRDQDPIPKAQIRIKIKPKSNTDKK